MERKPIIGITSTILDIEIKGEVNPSVQTNHQYVKAVIEIGGIPIVLPVANAEMAREYIDLCDGIIFASGEDVTPTKYNETPSKELQQTNLARDEMELPLVQYAVENKIPILGTCRGLGVINVALGGSMKQNIVTEESEFSHNQEVSRKLPSHEITIEEDSHLFQMLGTKKAKVNSKHHQAINEVADCLRVAATAEDGVIEAIEARDKDAFILGLQFHPEELYAADTHMLNLLMLFREACEK
ncbi:gamma-glutamyl-gamma-aminobutyrate hydrolase family protein [Oceanobacillus piezotolerans]|uniref:Gamma-glutamyl-gamma-aminobutyrate hydrolase family protein n=1 Tax=Oceanobacillus piezotolerans TaxID=2448030 RepID=A0A498DR68_9BACI|nr:gamma-glutamyl-gamma-aminobutyrate hydrolase family protein [Oceanobacillus piezotolerans]RLL46959.1 gamma-glutamyl-gamma-aminobutyrate hydrolase family protein [Oceanobacillus piezotolerans]